MEKEKKIKLVKIVAIIIGIIYVGIIMKHYFFIGGKEFNISFFLDYYNNVNVEDKSIVRYVKCDAGGSFTTYEFRALKPGTTNVYFSSKSNKSEIITYEVVVDKNLNAQTTKISNDYDEKSSVSPYDLTKETLKEDRLFYITPEINIENIKEVRVTDEELVEYLGKDETNKRFVFKASQKKGKSTIYLDYKEPTESYVVREQYQIEILDGNVIDKVPVIDYRDVEYPKDYKAVYREDWGIMIILEENRDNVEFKTRVDDEEIITVTNQDIDYLAENRMRTQIYVKCLKEGEAKLFVDVYNKVTGETETEQVNFFVESDLSAKYYKENYISYELH